MCEPFQTKTKSELKELSSCHKCKSKPCCCFCTRKMDVDSSKTGFRVSTMIFHKIRCDKLYIHRIATLFYA